VDAAHVDLKGFDEDTYQKLNSGKLQPILNTLKTLKELGVWFEIINLVVPTYTDNLDTIRRMCGWIAKEPGAGPAAALLALPPAAQARRICRPRPSRRS
jgi:pyruvate-formate lyase-activating enzyme